MRGKYKKMLLGGSTSIAVVLAALPFPGCDTMLFDPQAFFAENTCNIFNCDTLFFLQNDHADDTTDDHDDVLTDDHDDTGMIVVDDHTH